MTHFYDYSQMIELVPDLNSVSTLKKGNVNSPLHTDYLNNKMKSTELRHTGATLKTSKNIIANNFRDSNP
mgnify:FL=1